jgi:7-cyano-7-deazaguanine synthase in queuosine biosynthesis
MKIIKLELSEISLPIVIFDGPVGISVSGGADSAILLYCLMTNTIEPIHVFTASLKTKNNTAPKFAFQVIEKCIELTGNSNVYHHVHFIEDMNQHGNLFDGYKFFLRNRLVSMVYTAETLMPPAEDFGTFKNQDYFIYNQRNTNNKNPILQKNFYSPFRHIDKKQIKNIYSKYNLLESLFPITRSCENTVLTEGHCGECLWCEERFWAFNRYT